MPRKSDEIRNREQRERQQKLREADRKAKRPIAMTWRARRSS